MCSKLEAESAAAQRDAVSVSLTLHILRTRRAERGISARALNSRGFMSFLSASVTHTLNSCHDCTPKSPKVAAAPPPASPPVGSATPPLRLDLPALLSSSS